MRIELATPRHCFCWYRIYRLLVYVRTAVVEVVVVEVVRVHEKSIRLYSTIPYIGTSVEYNNRKCSLSPTLRFHWGLQSDRAGDN